MNQFISSLITTSSRLFNDDEGTTTIEYAMAALAAAALAGILYLVVTSDAVRSALEGIITDALSNRP